ncbi:MAG: hypothetical protein QXG39_04800 [Candidatus Aenigmatarchaeota archaeon]
MKVVEISEVNNGYLVRILETDENQVVKKRTILVFKTKEEVIECLTNTI